MSSSDGLGVRLRILMPEVRGSSPNAGSIYYIDRDCPGLSLLQKPSGYLLHWQLLQTRDFSPLVE